MINKIINLFSNFDKSHKIKFIYIQLIIIISSLLEIASIFSVGPLIQLINNPNIIYDNTQFISKVFNFFEFNNYKDFLIFSVITIFLILLISTTILSLTLYYLCMFSVNLGNIVRVKLFKFFVLQPWIYHTNKNTSEYIKKISHVAERITGQIILPIFVTNAKLITGVLIVISLTVYNPIVSISCILLFGIAYGLVFKILRLKIDNLGRSLETSQSEMYRIMSQVFGGIKEAIIYGNQKKHFDDFYQKGLKYSFSDGKIQFFAQFPRYLLELIAFGIVLLFILLLVYFSRNNNFNETLPVLAIYIFAGYKLLPIFQSIYVGFVQVRANLFALDTIQEELSLSKQFFFKDKDEETISIQFKEEILLKNVTFYFDDKSKNAVKDINLKIIPNSITYIIGPSGSGKSTLLDLILGLLFPKKGEISIDGINLTNQNSSAWHKNIGYVGQSIFLIDDTLKNNVTFRDFKSFNEEKFNKAIELSNVNDFLKDLPNGVDTMVGERGLKLSGGQRQRIAIARALYQDKSILFFDEATVSLDGISENYIIEKLKMLSKTKTIIIVTHNIKLLKDASLIYLLNNGEIIKKGNFEDFKNNELFNKLLNEKK